MKFGLQTYTVRNEINKNFEDTFQRIKDEGYEYVELPALYGKNSEELRDFLKNINLPAASVMFTLEDFEKKLDYVVETCKILGAKYAVVPVLPADYWSVENAYHKTASILEKASEFLISKGITLAYHNHAFEFERFSSGKCGYDILIANTKYLTFELDVFWIQSAGINPVDKIEELGKRISLLHLKDGKDMSKKEFCELGSGIINIPSIIKLCIKLDIEFAFVEQDANWINNNELESIKISSDYLKSIKI